LREKAAYRVSERTGSNAGSISRFKRIGKKHPKADFVVVQELFLTETAKQTDVVLPALAWAERDGTFTNAERRV
jgi:predicted molibdopterin-dependent oxidoreductase YjgC